MVCIIPGETIRRERTPATVRCISTEDTARHVRVSEDPPSTSDPAFKKLVAQFLVKMAPLRTLLALCFSLGVASGFAPVKNVASKSSVAKTRYDKS
jgi:hypothetical protein